jgi:hypothetical protein
MAHYLPSESSSREPAAEDVLRDAPPAEDISDLKVFWGPEMCRLEYLVHLLDTGRIKDEYWRQSA